MNSITELENTGFKKKFFGSAQKEEKRLSLISFFKKMQEKRKFIRIKTQIEADYKIAGDSNLAKKAPVENLSFGGIQLAAAEALQNGTLLELNLNIPNYNKKLSFTGKVVWQLHNKENTFLTGINFTQISPEDKNILSEFILKSTGKVEERRRFLRNAISLEVKYAFLENPLLEYTCLSSNISAGGMKLHTKEKILIGSKLKLSFKLPNDDNPTCPEVIVLWIKKKEDDVFETGVVFTRLDPLDRNKLIQYSKNNSGAAL